MEGNRMSEYGGTRSGRRVRCHDGEPAGRLVQCRQGHGPSGTRHRRQGDRVGGGGEGCGPCICGGRSRTHIRRRSRHRDACRLDPAARRCDSGRDRQPAAGAGGRDHAAPAGRDAGPVDLRPADRRAAGQGQRSASYGAGDVGGGERLGRGGACVWSDPNPVAGDAPGPYAACLHVVLRSTDAGRIHRRFGCAL